MAVSSGVSADSVIFTLSTWSDKSTEFTMTDALVKTIVLKGASCSLLDAADHDGLKTGERARPIHPPPGIGDGTGNGVGISDVSPVMVEKVKRSV